MLVADASTSLDDAGSTLSVDSDLGTLEPLRLPERLYLPFAKA